MKAKFENTYSTLQQQIIDRLAEIEQSDADACAGCGGEDCICCEIYHDRQKWTSPDELFADDDFDNFGFRNDDDEFCSKCHNRLDEWCEDCGLCPDCCSCKEDKEQYFMEQQVSDDFDY